MTALEIGALKARLKAAGRRAAFNGERPIPRAVFRDGVATIGVHFMRDFKTTERMTLHGSVASAIEERKLIDDVLTMLEHRAQRPDPRKETLRV